jgi:predicted translation initiation factor SUI1
LITGALRIGPPDLTPPSQKVTPSPVTAPINKKQAISVGRETKGRKGKGVTILSDLPMNEEQIHELATTLKSKCGTGGTVKDGKIEIQGDQRERIIIELEKLGFKTKKVGG